LILRHLVILSAMFHTIELSNPDLAPPGVTFVTVKSAALKRRADLTCYVPRGIKAQKLPLVILLHGIYGSHWAWIFKGGAHRVLNRLIEHEGLPPMMLAMPSDGLWGDGSGYVQHADADYVKWIVDEVPAAAALVEPNIVGGKRFITGLSMGGYGALRLGALHADQFAAISAHSSATALAQLMDAVQEPASAFDLTERDPLQAIECLKANAHRLPPLRFDCGTDDFLLEPNRALHRDLDRAQIPHEYVEFPGAHTWDYWHEHLADSLRFFAKHL
jgi:enterochelin esterase-like enzyme